MSASFNIAGMHCKACVQKITAALQEAGLEGTVTLTPPRVTFESQTPASEIIQKALAKAGDYRLVNEAPVTNAKSGWFSTYYPLLLIMTLISIVSLKGVANKDDWMFNFMAGFFLVFAGFKLLDLKGFRDAYATYDLLAKKVPAYGYIYPFLELGLGFAFLFSFHVQQALWFSIGLMGFSTLGVLQAVLQKRDIQCACLGTAFKLPMSTVTLVEDVGMVVMAIAMLGCPM